LTLKQTDGVFTKEYQAQRIAFAGEGKVRIYPTGCPKMVIIFSSTRSPISRFIDGAVGPFHEVPNIFHYLE